MGLWDVVVVVCQMCPQIKKAVSEQADHRFQASVSADALTCTTSLSILSNPPSKVPDTLGTSPWRLRGSDEYPKGQQRSLLTDMTANDPREGWDGVNMSGPPPQ